MAIESLKLGERALYYLKFVRHAVRPHRLVLQPGERYRQHEAIRPSRALHRQWQRLLALEPPGSLQTLHARAMLDGRSRALARLGVSINHARHLGSVLHIDRPGFELLPDTLYSYDFELADVAHINLDRALLFFETQLRSSKGESLLRQRDAILVRKLARSDIDGVLAWESKNGDALHTYRTLDAEPARLSFANAKLVASYFVPRDAGARYGSLSGDLNPLHTSRLMPRLFGHERPFTQGMYTLNLVLRLLAERGPLRSLDIRLARPLYVSQRVELLAAGERFELQDVGGQLLAFGEHHTFES